MIKNALLPDKEHLVVQRCGNELRLLNRFSDKKNILLRFIEGNMIAAFMDSGKSIDRFSEGTVFHYGWDDLAPWILGNYEMIGANHGSIFTFRVHTLRHWCFTGDVGKVFADEAGNEFVLTAVENLSDLLFHSRAVMQDGRISFADRITGTLTAADKRSIVPQTVSRIQLPNRDSSVLTTHNRYNSVKILADGKPLAPGECVRCKQAEMQVDMDLCPPDALCEYLVKNPGRYVAPNAPELESMIHTGLSYIFQPDNTMQINAEIEFLRELDSSVLYGLLQYYGEKFFAVQEKFVPKLKAFASPGLYDHSQTVDLGSIWQVPNNSNISKVFTQLDCYDENDPPCRYIDFFGDGKKRQLGVMLGYSRLHGMTAATAPARKGINMILPTSGKIYPYALSLARVNKGEKFNIHSYRQFFEPIEDFNGAMCGHYEGNTYCFSADCAAGGTYTLQLPEKFAGCAFDLIEEYGQITLPAGRVLDGCARVNIKFADRSGVVLAIKSVE